MRGGRSPSASVPRTSSWPTPVTACPITVDVVEELGADAYIYGSTKEHQVATEGDNELAKPFIARVDGRQPPEKGSVINLAPKEGHLHVFNTENGERIST